MNTVFKHPSVSIVVLFCLFLTQTVIWQLLYFTHPESKSDIFRLRNKRKVLNQYLDLDSRSRFFKFLGAIILSPFYITSTSRSIIYEVLFTRNSCHYGTCLLLPNSKEIKIMKSPLQEEVRVLLSACSLIGQIFGTFFPLLLKINKVVEMTIDSQINLLIHGIDCFFG